MKHLILAITVISFAVIACKKSTPANPYVPTYKDPDTTGPAVSIDSFPLKVGNIWVYSNGDTITAASDTMMNGTHAVRLVVKDTGNHSVSLYVANMPDGLHQLVGFTNMPGIVFPPYYNNSTTETFAPPAFLAKFPADSGDNWKSYKYGYRHWNKYVTVTTAAGTFNCVRLMAENGINEYYSNKGLIKVAATPVYALKTTSPPETTLVYTNF